MADQIQVLEKSQEKISAAFAQADSIIMRKYMLELGQFPVKDIAADMESININSVLRLNRIEKIVYDTEENNLDKLMNVYHSVALCGGAVIHIILGDGEKTECYIGTRTSNMNGTATCQAVLAGTFEGNFPGSKLVLEEKRGLASCMEKIFGTDGSGQGRVISAVSGIPGLRSEDRKEFVQGMEKLVDSMAGSKYAMVTIAEPVPEEQIRFLKDNYEEIYSQLSPFAKVTQTYSESDSSALAESISEAVTESVGNTVSKTVNRSRTESTGTNASKGSRLFLWSKNKGTSTGESRQSGSSFSDSQNETKGETVTKGQTDTHTATTGQTLQLVRENKQVVGLLHKIEKQIERIENARDTGLWSTAVYCIADDVQTSKILSGTVQSLCRGKKDSVESYSINTWTDPYRLKKLEAYLRKMVHPLFEMRNGNKVIEVSPASMISGSELVITAGLPQKAVSGVAVSKMVPFARNVTVEDGNCPDGGNIFLGNIYHMGKVEKTKVHLDVESLASHMLVTGSTGSGKSNTVYTIISEARKKGIRFLVVEPAKGEYRQVFGNGPDVNVFGTNRKFTPLLRINPFSFPDDIHVLEHVDRLVEIFNVCWPMYAAMPAVLKDAVLRSYLVCGWDLDTSENRNGIKYYPSFKDLQRQIGKVIDSSAYSEEVKGNYIGSLATRINSLTNGINGQMFTSDEIEASVLFDENTLIDLSRVGSQETKSLIMGVVVMKLNEYRMSEAAGNMNQKLKHLTVLEEAHHLLRNTQGRQGTMEGADLAGKSVEMISNSIAEMRTYGEGFMIVDQSPGAIDISAIRNTNTKILMRLPEQGDRQQAGRAAALSEKQIHELSKLPKGVAVVYQNNWLDPVLCKINKMDMAEQPYLFRPDHKASAVTGDVKKMTLMMLVGNRMDEYLDISAEMIRAHMDCMDISTESKILILDAVASLERGEDPAILEEDSFAGLSRIVCEILSYDGLKHLLDSVDDVKEIQNRIHVHLFTLMGGISKELEYALSQCILRQMATEDGEKVELYARWREFAVGQRREGRECG